ncbi:serine protease [Vibrio sp. Vb5031]|uniref:S1 family peptidase n=2 Tax=Vibrio TaxID=662 RepID=UPI00215F42DF|nr:MULTISPECIES: serine protease [Vibrio]MDW1505826.1 serine protease [Vibrio sp. Vb5031]MDW2008478.1 serine protease [Vibrio sp. 431]MDW2182895.1 serine protease [Vibrio sp. 1762]MDW2226564.1 serine protease [Vibrio sp. 1761]MDW2456286.1 serine protease [Vibrio sp. 1249-1]
MAYTRKASSNQKKQRSKKVQMKKLSLFGAICSVLLLTNTSTASSEEYSTYIYNGLTTTTDTWPSYAALYYDASSYTGVYGQYCGATIIDANHVATAAHCISDGSGGLNEEYLVYTAVLPQLSNSNQFLSGAVENIRITNVYRHPDYVDSSSESSVPWPNDIAILELEDDMNVSSSDYAVLAESTQADSYRVEDESFIAVGLGMTESGSYSDQLLYTTLTYVPTDSCDMGAGENQLCMQGAYNASTGVRNSTCSGDSGGPLYWYDDDLAEYVQVGITSYGWDGCKSSTSSDTSVFTEVADYSDWIESVLNDEITPDLVVTSTMRDSYNTTVEDADDIDVSGDDESDYQANSGSSGGSTSFGAVFFLLMAAFIRKRSTK